MTPSPTPSEDGPSLPPRSRLNLSDLNADTSERDLWSFDDAESTSEGEPEPTALPQSVLPKPRLNTQKRGQKHVSRISEITNDEHVKSISSKGSIRVDVSKNTYKGNKLTGAPGVARVESDFDDLDDLDAWDEPATAPQLAEVGFSSPENGDDLPEISETGIKADPVTIAPEVAAEKRKEETPIALTRLGLSAIEKLGLALLLALLLIGGGVVYFLTIWQLPQSEALSKANHFPIKGRLLTVAAAESYWREPVTHGENADAIRPGTVLLPALNLLVEEGTGAIRVFFRNGDGIQIGDTVTRAVKAGVKTEIAATSGFEESGMYAGYRTGQSKSWTVEVLEASATNAPAADFKKLFEMTITADLR